MKLQSKLILTLAMVFSSLSFADDKKHGDDDKKMTAVKAIAVVSACTASQMKNSGKDCDYDEVYDAGKVLEEAQKQNNYLGEAATKVLEAEQAVLDLKSWMEGHGRDQD